MFYILFNRLHKHRDFAVRRAILKACPLIIFFGGSGSKKERLRRRARTSARSTGGDVVSTIKPLIGFSRKAAQEFFAKNYWVRICFVKIGLAIVVLYSGT